MKQADVAAENGAASLLGARQPPVADIASADAADDFGEPAVPARAETGCAPPVQAVDPAEVMALVLIERALAASALDREAVRLPATVVTVLVPTEDWVAPACTAWTESVSGPESTCEAERFPRRDNGPAKTVTFTRTRNPLEATDAARDARDADFLEALYRGHCSIGFAANLALLPHDLAAAADHRLVLEVPSPDAISEAAERITGTPPASRLTKDEAACATPRLLRLARRPGQTADAYLRKLGELLSLDHARPAAAAPQSTTGKPRPAPPFERLSGMDEAVAWGRTLRADLAAMADGSRSWSDVDRGILLSGPPGCGKTMFAQSLAAWCGLPLIEGSWSLWLGTGGGHQGSMLTAMRKCFEHARKFAPCILFVDEIDSFHDRAAGTRFDNWSVPVVNALLAELDGVGGREGVVVVGACNHPHLLDPALVRSGRLERHIRIGLPDRKALADIMRVHLGTLLPEEALLDLALLASGSTGADAERFVRGARRRAREAGRPLTLMDLRDEIAGPDVGSAPDRRRAMVHEAGHAVVAVALGLLLEDVSIRRSGGSGGGATVRKESRFQNSGDIRAKLAMALAGRAAEEVLLGEPSSGAGGSRDSDLAKATRTALSAVSELGLGADARLLWTPVPDRDRELAAFVAGDPALAARAQALLADAYELARSTVIARRAAVERVADLLSARGALDGHEVAAVVQAAGDGGMKAPGHDPASERRHGGSPAGWAR